ncbi:MAG TPA: DinB family protein [Thermoanaerobaculia bacterium]|jgi:uncharacterized damage-inducible protein DinB|nr:DinB family protein [Thermoanaerobaculia bacterium]
MRRHFATAATLALLAFPAFAHDPAEGTKASAGDSVRADIQAQIDEAETKLTQLAEAMPAEKYAWRPGEKVRSVGEVFMHVAGGNYFLTNLMGAPKDEKVNPREFDKDANDKAKTIATMKASFDYVRKYLATLSDADLNKKMKVFDHDGTAREMALVVATHVHEHLGQSIAYARMNGVVPPWSQ